MVPERIIPTMKIGTGPGGASPRSFTNSLPKTRMAKSVSAGAELAIKALVAKSQFVRQPISFIVMPQHFPGTRTNRNRLYRAHTPGPGAVAEGGTGR